MVSSQIINFVAGGGKTTFADNVLKERGQGGLYLAFTNSVVSDMKNNGHLSATISSLFFSYILPKFFSHIPIIAEGSKMSYNPQSTIADRSLGNIKIYHNGELYNRTSKISVDLNTDSKQLHQSADFPNRNFLKKIFAADKVYINDDQRDALSWYIVKNYPDKLVDILESRFDYIIIDEAQDIRPGYMEEFVDLLLKSKISLMVLGDPHQNINNGSEWFAKLTTTESIKHKTYRCPEVNCEWIRQNLNIEIYGKKINGGCSMITLSEINEYNDGQRFLLYSQKSPAFVEIINSWKGPKNTIRSAKGSTIEEDIVIIGKTMNVRNMYTAITRTTKKAFYTVEGINK